MAVPIYSPSVANTPGVTHTMGNFEGYTAKSGQLFLAASFFVPPAANATGVTLVKNALGNYSWHVAASITAKLFVDLGMILRQTVLPPIPSQNGKIYSTSNPNSVGTGLAIVGVNLFYTISAVNLAAAGQFGIAQAIYPADNTATGPTVTNILAPSNTSTAFRTNMYNTAYTPTNQSPLVLNNSAISAELDVTTPAGGTFDLYGALLALNYIY